MANPRKTRSSAAKSAAPDPTREIAWRAVRNFQAMIPSLTGFARALTGNNKLIVRNGKNTETDGKTIFIRPPFALGEELVHERSQCDVRDPNTRLFVCPACRRSDSVWHKLHHEMSHVLGETLVPASMLFRYELKLLVDEWHPKGVCTHAASIKSRQDSLDKVFAVADTVPFLSLIIQALEDVRVDTKMLSIKPGLASQFYASTWDTFSNGVENDNGPNTMWIDMPVNAQLIIGLMLLATGYELQDGWLRPEIKDILADPKLMELIASPSSWLSVQDAGLAGIDVFRRFNELGLCKVDKCVPPEDQPSLNNPGGPPKEEEKSDDPEPESGEDQTESGDAEDGDEASDSDPDSSSDDGSSDDDADPTGDGTPGDSATEPATDTESDDPETSDAGSDGEDNEAPIPGEDPDGDGDASSGGDTDEATDADDELDPAGGDGSTEANPDDSADDASEDDGDQGEVAPGEPDTAGDPTGSASDTDRDSDGEPDADCDGSDEEDGDAEDSAEDAAVAASADGESSDQDPSTDDAEDSEEAGSEALGSDVWEEDNPALQAVRSIEVDDLGDLGQIEDAMSKWSGHEDPNEINTPTLSDEDPNNFDEDEEILVIRSARLDDAISQAGWFDRASVGVEGVKEYTFPEPLFAWIRGYHRADDFMPNEGILGPALLLARRVFAENARSKHERHLRSGRVDGKVLGRRAALGDDRLFKQRQLPGKRDYVVGITVDCSGSTQSSHRMERIKRAVFAKAELLSRLGINFYITGHTGGIEEWWSKGMYADDLTVTQESLMILWIKKIDEPWNDATRQRLANLMPLANNFDGHTLEFHRKILEGRRETDKILIYYTDGAMPAANYDEELVVLIDELDRCNKSKIHRLAVGINTDSPERYGFDTVRVDSDDDLIKVVQQLERYLLG